MDEELRKIWWIASFPKSGNTLVRLFVNAYVTKFPLDINASYQYACIDQQVRFYQQISVKPISECHPVEIMYLRPAMLMHYIQSVAPRDACFKTHNANLNIDGIPLIPQRLTKQAVYLVRDPRDIAISYAKHSGKTIDTTIDVMASNEHTGKRGGPIEDIISSWSTHVDSWTRQTKFPVEIIRFEDLVTDRDTTFRKILPALGFRNIDEEGFAFALKQTSFDNLQRLERENGFREAKHDVFFNVGKVNYWQEILTTKQILQIENNHMKSMELCGYKLSCHQKSEVGV